IQKFLRLSEHRVFTIRHSRLKILVFYWLAVKMSLYALALSSQQTMPAKLCQLLSEKASSQWHK
ncbi:MAG: hypothetical protein LBQ61_02255, partial [Spirochaetales bacterium]|nr:hypothetical protein [Spirochaetales bacterium]